MMFKKLHKNMLYLLIFSAYLALAGCGTKGPLYIPEQRYPQGAENNAPKNVIAPTMQANIDAPFRPAFLFKSAA